VNIFNAELQMSGNNTGIEVPQRVLDELGGGKRPRVKVTLNGFSFSLTLGSMGSRVMIPVSAERRAAAGVEGGQNYDVGIELDTAPEDIELPLDFAATLAATGLTSAYSRLAPSHRKEHVRAINDAKTEETRQRRIAKAVEMIQAKAK
jgi:Bacteriocin-protection, YdeI or OmpD-Associated/Domain of unknown function (DUF1905)